MLVPAGPGSVSCRMMGLSLKRTTVGGRGTGSVSAAAAGNRSHISIDQTMEPVRQERASMDGESKGPHYFAVASVPSGLSIAVCVTAPSTA